MNQIRSFVVILQFLTRIPLPWTISCDEETFERGLFSFALVGVVLGIALVGVAVVIWQIFYDAWVVAILASLFHIYLTGGLHLDGLADSADGLLSNREPSRMLEIMKDSRIGSNGVLALIGILALKVVGMRVLIDFQLWPFLFMMPVMGRCAVVFGCYKQSTPRTQGMGNLFIGHVSWKMLVVNAAVVLVLWLVVPLAPLALLGAMAFTWLFNRWVKGKIGGITGDVLGAIIELNEVVYLLFMAVLVSV
jgi:adenosylcobinamide-GDP ribazoletransferase